MPVVRVIHWRAAEAVQLLDVCRSGGNEVEYLERDGGAICRAIRTKPPDVIVIDLSRLPSHGREVAVWLRNTKPTRTIPIVFVGGEPPKVAAVRALLPDAAYCELSNVAVTVKKVAKASGRREPVTPPTMMERGREKAAAEKLGIVSGSAVAVIEPPRDFPGLLGVVPESVEFLEEGAPITLWFVHDRGNLLASLRQMRTTAARSKLWLLWRKGASGDALTQNVLRETTRQVGLVDYKICAVDSRWSAMLFARAKA
jgi:CheY-like chemotaxis protein